MLQETRGKEPFVGLWFGNFFEPAYSSATFRAEGVRAIQKMGFNNILLDTKAWKDFFQRCAGGEASLYVAGQEHMMEEILRAGMSWWFLAIYLNGDNLYPNIRYSPPVYGESVTAPDGKDGKWYKYWSPKAQASMIQHLQGLYRRYGEGAVRLDFLQGERFPICSMWDPVVEFSYDEEGIARYRSWLKQRYQNIQAFNRAYDVEAPDFSHITPDMYRWEKEQGMPWEEDFCQHTPLYYRYTDALRWKADELTAYFASMQEKIHELDPRFYTSPVLSQWGMFLNIAPQPHFRREAGSLWDTCQRGIDPYRIAPHVDCCTFITVPMLENAHPSPYASSCQNSMIRCMNRGREFMVGFYLGRYLYEDLYQAIAPAEMFGMAAAAGAGGCYSYGYGGLDDGGVMHKLGEPFRDSVRTGSEWFKAVVPQIRGERLRQAAVLYPAQMALIEPYDRPGNALRRRDLLGWYQALCDLGLNTDVLHPTQYRELEQYRVLALPIDSCYEEEISPALETALADFVKNGGLLLASAGHPVLRRVFGIEAVPHDQECLRYQGEGIIPGGIFFESYHCGDVGQPLMRYEDTGDCAAAVFPVGKGRVAPMGMWYGAEYLMEETGAVPPQYGNRDLYPLCVAEHDPVGDLVRTVFPESRPVQRGIEIAAFTDGWVIVNHTSSPWNCAGYPGERQFQYEMADRTLLMGHSAVWIQQKEESV